MSRNFVLAFAGGLLVVALLIAGVFYKQRGDHMEPSGRILKVRSAAPDEQRSLAVLDFRVRNNSDISMEIRDLTITLTLKDGSEGQGTLLAASDARQIFRYYPALGEQYNEPAGRGTRIPGHQVQDLMLAARFDTPEAEFDSRRKLLLTLQDRTLLKLEVTEDRK